MDEHVSVNYVNFNKEKPPKKGTYLWALNNWWTKGVGGGQVHTCEVEVCYWDGNKFFHGSHRLIDPDQWADIPYPRPVDKP